MTTATQKQKPPVALTIGFFVLICSAVAWAILKPASRPNPVLLERALQRVSNRADVAWVETEDEKVFINFKEPIEELDAVVRITASKTSLDLKHRIQVFGLVGADRGWRPDRPSAALRSMHVANHGRFEK